MKFLNAREIRTRMIPGFFYFGKGMGEVHAVTDIFVDVLGWRMTGPIVKMRYSLQDFCDRVSLRPPVCGLTCVGPYVVSTCCIPSRAYGYSYRLEDIATDLQELCPAPIQVNMLLAFCPQYKTWDCALDEICNGVSLGAALSHDLGLAVCAHGLRLLYRNYPVADVSRTGAVSLDDSVLSWQQPILLEINRLKSKGLVTRGVP